MCLRTLRKRSTLLLAGVLLWSGLASSGPLAAQDRTSWCEKLSSRRSSRRTWIFRKNDAPRGTTVASDPVNPLIQRLPSVESWQGKRFDDAVRQVTFAEAVANGVEVLENDAGVLGAEQFHPMAFSQLDSFEAPARLDEQAPLPIDLANALATGGASHLEIQLARQRLIEAQAGLTEARALWLPSFRFGLGWNKHDGRLQEAEGNIIQVSRNSLFAGGGAGLGNVPLAGGASGPFRLGVNLSLSDAIFEKRAAAWVVQAACADQVATRNRALRDIAVAYFDLLEAHGLLANAHVGYDAADELLKLTTTFEREGAGTRAEVDRATTELTSWRQKVEDAQRLTIGRSANLIRLLRFNQQGTLVPVEGKVTPLNLVDPGVPVEALTAEAMNNRPEITQLNALIQAAAFRTRQEHLRPWLPNVQAGASGGTFGGGTGSTFENDGDRSDVDVLAVWELENAGLGNHAAFRRRRAQLSQARLQLEWVRDQVTAEIVTNAGDVTSYRNQMEIALDRVAAAGKSYDLNRERISEGEGIPIELVQAIRARVEALNAYTQTVANYNRSQYRLLQSIGRSAT